MKRFYLLLIQLLILVPVWSQIAPGKWEYHLSMNNTKDVIEAGQKIYFLSEGGIFYFNKSDNSVGKLSKLESLSGSSFSCISYNETTKSLIIAYKNSAIDVVGEDGEVHPILDIKRKYISGDKQIFHITNNEKYCYLSCGFGIVVIDLQNLNVKDSYLIGDTGESTTVYDVAFIDGYIFAGTRNGIKYAPAEGVNLLDYSEWKYVDNKFLNYYNYNILETGWNRLWAVHNNDPSWWGDRTVSRHGEEIWYPEFEQYGSIRNFRITNGYLIYCTDNHQKIIDGTDTTNVNNSVLIIYNEQKEKIAEITTYPFANSKLGINPLSAYVDKEGVIWIADEYYGGIRLKNGDFTQLSPEGPNNNYVYSIAYSDGQLLSTSGGHGNAWENMMFDFNVNSYIKGHWKSYNQYSSEIPGTIKDALQVIAEPGNPNHFYVATWGYGLLEFENGALKKLYNEKNSNLQTKIEGGDYIRLGGMDFDSKGNLWISNSLVENNLHELKPDGTWKSYYLPEIANSGDINTGQVLVTKNDDIWMIVPHNKTKGLYLVSSDGITKKQLDVIAYFSNGDQTITTTLNDVYSIAEDQEGAIWVGTSGGICVYDNPEDVMAGTTIYGAQPELDLNDGLYHALLQNATITAIAVDGGNRKWCGSKSDGLYLVSADGRHELEHFTTENSPLISDEITSLAFDGKTGILYIGTQLGLVSYRTDSKDSNERFTNVYAYPNPVRENYSGKIYITGLMSATNVKITTVSGRLVYETTSNGGEAVWDGNDLAGNRVHTGIYLAFCTSSDGSQSTVTKILFIR